MAITNFILGLLVIRFRNVSCQNCSLTIIGGPQERTPCVFPFMFKGQLFNECTSFDDPENRLWCSTKIDEHGYHIGGGRGFWGYCDQDCISKSTDQLTPPKVPPLPDKVEPLQKEEEIVPLVNGTWLPKPGGGQCGLNTNVGYIVGGAQATRGEFPFMALLGYEGPRGVVVYLCGGTLINKHYVITAAHCQGRSRQEQIRQVVLGEYNIDTDPDCLYCRGVQRFDILAEDVIVHRDWNTERIFDGNDIALIRLPRPAKTFDEDVDEWVLPVCLPIQESGAPTKEYISVGWGQIGQTLSSTNFAKFGAAVEVLRKLTMPLVSNEECRIEYQREMPSNFLCAGAELGKDTCSGDSGGPLIVRNGEETSMWLAGVVSFGTQTCGAGKPAVFTNIKHYMPWIQANLKP